MSDVKITVQSQLMKIAEDLQKINAIQSQLASQLKTTTEDVGKAVQGEVKNVESGMAKMREFGRRVADQLRGDFKSLFALNAISSSLSLSKQFSGTITEAVNLSDTIRRLDRTFGIGERNFVSFQAKMVQGLGAIGLSSEVAARSMEGLADTPVRGEEALLQYSKTAGELASIGGQRGREGDIAGGIARVIKARGGDPNDLGQVRAVGEDLRRARNATGKGPAELLGTMESLFTNMSKDFREKISTRGLVNLAAAGQVAGPNSTKFLQEFLAKSPIARKALEAQGFKGVFTNQGIDVAKFQAASQSVLKRVGGDPRLAAQTLGLSEDAAEGFIRLSESLQQVKAAQDQIATSTGNLEDQYKSSRGLTESFQASINNVKGVIAEPLAFVTQKGTDMLSGAANNKASAAAVTLGGAGLAAGLAGAGLKGVGAAIGLGGGGAGILGTVAPPLAAAGGGAYLGKKANDALEGYVRQNPNSVAGRADAKLADAVKSLAEKIGLIPKAVEGRHKLDVQLKSPELKKATPPGRGGSY